MFKLEFNGFKFLEGSCKIAGFDIDSTIIKTKYGKTFAKDTDDWMFVYPGIPEKLKELIISGYNIVFFTNQKGIGNASITNPKVSTKGLKLPKNKPSKEDFEIRMNKVSEKLGIPLLILVAIDDSKYRKPELGMWEELDTNISIDYHSSFYVGDAAGRKKDFSCSDRKFAMNIQRKYLDTLDDTLYTDNKFSFHTPENFFEGKPEEQYEIDFDPLDTYTETVPFVVPDNGTVVIFVGFPGSGKTTYYNKYFKDSVYINQDILKTKNKCHKIFKDSIKGNTTIVVDNTNPSIEARKFYIDEARSNNKKIVCYNFTTSRKCSEHLNSFRDRLGIRSRVPSIVYNIYNKNFIIPSLSENFDEIVDIPFNPEFSDTDIMDKYIQFYN